MTQNEIFPTCPIIGCKSSPAAGYECCNVVHGHLLKMYRTQIKEALDADLDRKYELRSLYSVADCQAYYF